MYLYGCGCPILGSAQGQVGQGLEQLDLGNNPVVLLLIKIPMC